MPTGLRKMGETPKISSTDDEGALNKEAIQKDLRDENREHHEHPAARFHARTNKIRMKHSGLTPKDTRKPSTELKVLVN